MTKEQLMDEMGTLLDLLDTVPDGTCIISAEIGAPYLRKDRRTVSLLISDNITMMAHRLGAKVERRYSDASESIHLTALTEKGEIVQVEEKENRP